MDNKEFAKKLEERTKKYAISVIQLSASLPNSIEGKVVKNQITKAGTGVGANYREANRSRSKPDFKNKITICETEASETGYWLEIIMEMKWLEKQKIDPVHLEANELLAIFTSIGKKPVTAS